MASDTLRIAVCQIECHPAVIVGDRDYLREPFVIERSGTSLSELQRHALDVCTIQDECEKRYTEWHSQRLNCILEWLAGFDPVPDIVVFPECSVPIHDLHLLKAFAVEHRGAVFAGTHTLRLRPEDEQHYDALGVSKKERKELKKRAGQTLLPIFCGDDTIWHVKSSASVFEHTDIGSTPETLTVLEPVVLSIRGDALRVLPAVCAEAIQLNAASGSYDLAVIVAYNNGIDRFEPSINQNVQNQVPVVFCNDGRFGQSSVNVVSDSRMDGIWWWSEPLRGRLPPGDGLLVVDIHLSSMAVTVGVANPRPPANLVALASVSAELAVTHAAAGEVGRIGAQDDNSLQAALLDACTAQQPMSEIQRLCAVQLKRLATVGTATPAWWQILGRSCQLAGLPDLRSIESELAGQCAEFAEKSMLDSSIESEAVLGKLARLKRSCAGRLDTAASDTSADADGIVSANAPLDREDDTREVRRFLADSQQTVLFVSGLDDVGKSTTIKLAFGQSGKSIHAWVDVYSDTSPAFLLTALAKAFRIGIDGIAANPFDAVADDELVNRIPLGAAVVIGDIDNLKDHGQWRDATTPQVLNRLVVAFTQRHAKLILIASRRVEIDEIEPRLSRRLFVRGLPEEFGEVLLENHLRRVGLEPSNYALNSRREVANALGCHPGAIILAAEYIEQEGFDFVLTDLRKRKQIHALIVRRILSRLSFTEPQLEILSLLGEARVPLPATVLAKSGIANALPLTQSLVHHSVVDRSKHDYVCITDLVRGFSDFAEVDPTTRQLFHKAAAETFASLANDCNSAEQLAWAVESRFHAQLAGDPNLAPNISGLLDGIVGALQRLVEEHEYERAKPIVDQLLKSDGTAELYQLAAIVYARLGKCDESLALVKEAMSKDESRTWVACEVGKLSLNVHRTDIAHQCVDLVKRIGHDSPYVATLQGRILLRESGEAASLPAFQRAVNLADGEAPRRDAWPHFYLGRTLLKLGKADEAVDVLYRGETIVSERRRPNRRLLTAIRTQLAIGYVYTNNLDGAKRILDLIASDGKGEAEVVWALALYRAARGEGDGDHDLASETLQELNPQSAKDRYGRCQVYLFRALIYLGSGNPERASEEFSRAHREDPRNVFVLLRWADTLIELARESGSEGEHQAARICAEHAKSLADKIIEFDRGNEPARQILERLHDEFNVT